MARLAEQSRGSKAKGRPHCQPHAPTVSHHTKFHRGVAGVPLPLAQAAAGVLCHILPGVTPAWTLQCQRHRAGDRAQHRHHCDPPAPDPPSTHRLCRWMKPRKEALGTAVKGFSVRSLWGQGPSVPSGTPGLAGTGGTPGTSLNLRGLPCTHSLPAHPRPWDCSPAARAQRSPQSC